jgi:hypothetical protein
VQARLLAVEVEAGTFIEVADVVVPTPVGQQVHGRDSNPTEGRAKAASHDVLKGTSAGWRLTPKGSLPGDKRLRGPRKAERPSG